MSKHTIVRNNVATHNISIHTYICFFGQCTYKYNFHVRTTKARDGIKIVIPCLLQF